MRYLVCILCSLVIYSTSFAAPPVKNKLNAPVVAVGLSVADPCQNSHYSNLSQCAGQVVQHVVDTSEKLPPFMINGEAIIGAADQAYRVRVIDYY